MIGEESDSDEIPRGSKDDAAEARVDTPTEKVGMEGVGAAEDGDTSAGVA